MTVALTVFSEPSSHFVSNGCQAILDNVWYADWETSDEFGNEKYCAMAALLTQPCATLASLHSLLFHNPGSTSVKNTCM
jgi:hypothetical protein